MAVALTSQITIYTSASSTGKFGFSGVHELRIKRSLHSYVDMAWMQLPYIANIIKKDGRTGDTNVLTGKQFNDGDKITISLGYDGSNAQEFEGFVKRRNFNHPMEVELEGYSYQLKRNKVSGFWKKISVRDLLAVAVKGTDVTVDCQVEMDMYNIRITEGCGADILDAILKASGKSLGLFFIESKKLFCGLIYTSTVAGTDVFGKGLSKYRLGFNCPKENTLRMRTTTQNPVEVHYLKKTKTGEKLSGKSKGIKDITGHVQRRVLNNIGTAADLQKLADEKEAMINYDGYEGRLTAFLWPLTQPGAIAYIKNTEFPERDGNYLVDGIELRFGQHGARREVEVQHKLNDA